MFYQAMSRDRSPAGGKHKAGQIFMWWSPVHHRYIHFGSLQTHPFSRAPGRAEVPPSALHISVEGEIIPVRGGVLILLTA